MKSVSIEEKLGVNKFILDEGNPHIITGKDTVEEAEAQKLIKACPAGLYGLNSDNSLRFDYAGCLECGTCRVLGKKGLIREWNYPQGSYGVAYRYG
ncbi:ferredoxin family protein [Desulfitobacterium chlororespirans]|uniref:Ferredoxin like protein n=1 Tax=Desulfitobacterium chlororespirans DSM 11544 TaxID=1121395 RepID=A0A1M7SXZ5_9FIRM|nr:ferredoxin family protein [Desulfitobacterium chlororespirans]SHN63373.1 ferredoxin like protein [Desulfitobacterium chlororespirans DSM 11544]